MTGSVGTDTLLDIGCLRADPNEMEDIALERNAFCRTSEKGSMSRASRIAAHHKCGDCESAPSSAAAMLPIVTDMFIQCRNVLSLAALTHTDVACWPPQRRGPAKG